MPCWIETSKGYVNLDHAVRLERPTTDLKRDWETWKVYLPGGLHLEGRILKDVWMPTVLANVVPAAAGQEAVALMAIDNYDSARPAGVDVVRYPVVAWRVISDDPSAQPTPVLPVPWASNEHIFFVLPEGRLLKMDGNGEEFSDLEDAKAAVLLEAQAQWDRRQCSSRSLKVVE